MAEDAIIEMNTFQRVCLPIPKGPMYEMTGTVREMIREMHILEFILYPCLLV